CQSSSSHQVLHPFPTRRSSDLVVVGTTVRIDATAGGVTRSQFLNLAPDPNAPPLLSSVTLAAASVVGGNSVSGTVFLSSPAPAGDRKSTRLNSSHLVISYAVFC